MHWYSFSLIHSNNKFKGRNFDYKLAKDNSAKLMSILLHHDLVILSVLCKVYESEELSKTVIRLFYAEGQALRLLIQLIYRDLKNTRTEETLFRFDSMATKTTSEIFMQPFILLFRKLLQNDRT